MQVANFRSEILDAVKEGKPLYMSMRPDMLEMTRVRLIWHTPPVPLTTRLVIGATYGSNFSVPRTERTERAGYSVTL